MTHVTERGNAGANDDADRQPWMAGSRGSRKRTITYADAGVSIHAGERAVELLKSKVQRTSRPEVMGDIGGFA